MAHPIENIMKTTMEQLKEMVDVNTIVGTPILTTGETMILPVSKVSMGFFSGGGEYGQQEKKEGKNPIARSGEELSAGEGACGYPFAGASVAGMTLTPLAFLSVNGGNVKVLPASCQGTLDRALELLPESITTLEQAIRSLCAKKHNEEGGAR